MKSYIVSAVLIGLVISGHVVAAEYVVQPDDTWEIISKNTDTNHSVEQLIKMNPSVDLIEGTKLTFVSAADISFAKTWCFTQSIDLDNDGVAQYGYETCFNTLRGNSVNSLIFDSNNPNGYITKLCWNMSRWRYLIEMMREKIILQDVLILS